MQCEYGTAKAGNVYDERCERDAVQEYMQLSEPIHLCEKHYDKIIRGDYYSIMR